jgi:hypothetical protein
MPSETVLIIVLIVLFTLAALGSPRIWPNFASISYLLWVLIVVLLILILFGRVL